MWIFLPAVAWGAVIFVIISIPPENIPRSVIWSWPRADKAIHFAMFAVLGALLMAGFVRLPKNPWPWRKCMLIALAIGLAYGSLTEFLQYCCIAGRHGNTADALANFFGTVFGVFTVALAGKKDRGG